MACPVRSKKIVVNMIKSPEKMATIIGGQGFIGRALAAHLTELQYAVWVPKKNDPQLFMRELGKVFYCAGLTADYLQRPFDTVNAHVSLLADILQRASWESLVYLSSARVYDGLSGAVQETDDLMLNPNNPRHLYDLSKLMGESLCLQTKRASVARLSCVYGDHEDQDGFLPNLIRQALNAKSNSLRVDSSPNFCRDYVHLSDVLSALVAINSCEVSSIYNVASGENVANAEIFSLLSSALDVSIETSTAVKNTASVPVVNIDKMKNSFGWEPKKLVPTMAHLLTELKAE